jgi:hypothetical protein
MKAEIKSLRDSFADKSFFFDEIYDEAIEGIDAINQSIIYNQFGMINITMEQNKEDFDGDLEEDAGSDEWNDFYDSFIDPVYEMFSPEEDKFSGKIPPILLEPLG